MRFVARVVLIVVVCVGLVASAAVAATIAGVKLPFETETIDRSQPVLLTSIQDISEFHAAVGNFEVVLDYEDDVSWVPGFLAGERSLFVAAGTVDAYVDFSGLADGDLELSADGETVEISLPPAELSEPNLDQDRTYLFSQSRGVVDRIGDAIATDDQQELCQEAEQKLATAAAESELMQQAEQNTRAMLSGMLGSLGLDVVFTVAAE